MLVPMEIVESVLMGAEHVAEEAVWYPEERLYMAIILQAIYDYEYFLKCIQANWLRYGEPVELSFAEELRTIRRDCQSLGFQSFCMWANVPVSKVFRKFQALDKQYGLINVVFTEHSKMILDHANYMRRRRTYNV